MSEYQEYPRVMYHAEKAPLTVDSPEEEVGLGEAWFRTPWEAKGEDQDGNKVENQTPQRPRRKKAEG